MRKIYHMFTILSNMFDQIYVYMYKYIMVKMFNFASPSMHKIFSECTQCLFLYFPLNNFNPCYGECLYFQMINSKVRMFYVRCFWFSSHISISNSRTLISDPHETRPWSEHKKSRVIRGAKKNPCYKVQHLH